MISVEWVPNRSKDWGEKTTEHIFLWQNRSWIAALNQRYQHVVLSVTPKHHFWRDRVTIDLLINISIFIKNGISFYHTSNTIWYHGCEHLFYHKSSKPGAIFEVKKFSFFANFDWQKWPIVFAHSIAKWTLVLKACHIQKTSNFQQPRRISIAPLRTFCTIFYSGDRCWCGMIWWGGIYRHRLLVHGAIDSAIAVFFLLKNLWQALQHITLHIAPAAHAS